MKKNLFHQHFCKSRANRLSERREISMISPNPHERKSQYLAFHNSPGVDKSYKMYPSRFSPVKSELKSAFRYFPLRELQTDKTRKAVFTDTSDFIRI